MNRRAFFRTAAAGALSVPVLVRSSLRSTIRGQRASDRKLVIVLFGGGTRSLDTIEDPQHRFIPRLWTQLVPAGTLFTNMRVEGKVVHPNSAGSIVTGHWEWDDLDWTHPVDHPTLFELVRKSRHLPETGAWAFVYASILSQVASSGAAEFGHDYAAALMQPPTIPRSTAAAMDLVLRTAAAGGDSSREAAAAAEAAALARRDSHISSAGVRSAEARAFVNERFALWQASSGSTSHDAFLAESALACMRQFAPDLLLVAFGEIDCAHYGCWSRYTDAIRQTDDLTWRLHQATCELPEYRDRTLFLVLPDHGRELDTASKTGFIHHSDFYTGQGADEGCRRVWMLATGPGVGHAQTLDSPFPITAVAATGARFLGLSLPESAAAAVPLPVAQM